MIYDITREMFSTPTFPGDPIPEKLAHTSFDKPVPDIYQVTKISMRTLRDIFFPTAKMWLMQIYRAV